MTLPFIFPGIGTLILLVAGLQALVFAQHYRSMRVGLAPFKITIGALIVILHLLNCIYIAWSPGLLFYVNRMASLDLVK